MSFSMAIITFLNVWWVTLFMVVPFSVRAETNPAATDYVAAPRVLRWKKLFIRNTILSLIITLVLAAIIKSGVISIRDFIGTDV